MTRGETAKLRGMTVDELALNRCRRHGHESATRLYEKMERASGDDRDRSTARYQRFLVNWAQEETNIMARIQRKKDNVERDWNKRDRRRRMQ